MKNLRIEQTNEMILDKFGMGIVEFLIQPDSSRIKAE